MQRWRGGAPVMSWPPKLTLPVSGVCSPVMRLNSVDLPAPLGPIMPSASPCATSRCERSTAFSEPNDLVRLSSVRITRPPSEVLAARPALSSSSFERPLERDDFFSNRHPALALFMKHDLSENRYPLFGIMLQNATLKRSAPSCRQWEFPAPFCYR